MKSGPDVGSEATIVVHGATGRRFLTVSQNALDVGPPPFIVDRTIAHFLGVP